MTTCLALDLGGTKLAAGLVDRSGALGPTMILPTPVTSDPEVLFSAVEELIAWGLATSPRAPVVCGVSAAGPMTPQGELVSPLNMVAWRNFPLRERLAERMGIPVHVDNDAKALALGEGWQGSARGVANFMAMVVSTGVGGGIVLDGRLLDGRLGNAGHVGHVMVVPDGNLCGCGARGCLEAEASGTAIAKITGQPAELGGPGVVARTGEMVGRGVASVANLCDLDLILVAGSVALGYGEPFFAAAQDALSRGSRLDHSKEARIMPGGLGKDGPLVGAGAVGWRHMGVDVLAP